MEILKKRLPLLLLLALYVTYALLSFKSFGITNDEPEDYLLGSFLYTKIRANDPVLERSFVIAEDGAINLAFYDRIYLAVLFALSGSINYQTYHLLNLLFFSIILIAAYELLLKETKRPTLALLGPLALLLTPRLFGDTAANHKDIPFAISYFVAVASIYFVGKKQSAKHLLVLGITFGITQSLRSVGYSIYFIYLIWLLLQEKQPIWQRLLDSIAQISVVFCIGLLVHFVTLPYLAADPFSRFLELFTNAKSFPWDGPMLFMGKLIHPTQLPATYIPTWFLITTPVATIILWIASIKLALKSKLAQLLWLSLGINGLILIVAQPTIYDGIRHLLFLLPLIAILACLSVIQLIKGHWRWKKIAIGLILANTLLVLVQYLLLFPYQYTYFNELVGYLPGGNNKFELDYWGASYKTAVETFNDQAERDRTYQLYFCGDPQQVKEYATFSYSLTPDISMADLLICHRRGDNQQLIDSFAKKNGFSVKRMGVPLTTVAWN